MFSAFWAYFKSRGALSHHIEHHIKKSTYFNKYFSLVEDSSTSWFGSDRDYTYDELLKRVFEIILDKNPDMAAGRKPKFVMRPPQVLRVGTKKTSFANFTDICKTLHRQPKHLLDFLLAELGTSGSMDGNQQLIIKGRFQPKQIENVLRRYEIYCRQTIIMAKCSK